VTVVHRDPLEAVECLIAEAEGCHAEEVRLVQALTGDEQSATEAERRLRETKQMVTLLHSVRPRSPATPKKC